MEDNDRANEAADEVGVAEPEQRRDDETESSDEDDSDEDNSDEEMEDSDSDDDDEEEEEEEEEWVPPTPEEVELEYTFPQDFQGRSWQDVVAPGQYFRLIIDPACINIPYEQFFECIYLIEIVFAKNSCLTEIREGAFSNCLNLQRMNPFPDGLIELGDSAFCDCWNLQGRITIPSSIRYVRYGCFNDCRAITSVIFEPSTSTTITVVELGIEIFAYCRELLSVRLPNNLPVIPNDCFFGCLSLLDVVIPRTVRTIQSGAFTYCALSEVDLPESVIVIDEAVYRSCSVLARVTIRSSTNVVQVGRDVFGDCPSLTTIRVVNPLVWSQLFSAMNTDPGFIYKFVRKYDDQIMTHHRSSR